MKKLRKHSVTLITVIFSFLLFCISITYVVLKQEQRRIRKEVKHIILEEVDESELVYFKFSELEKNALQWKHAGEFKYRGEMYDIVRKNEKNGIFEYWCWADNKETVFNQKIERLIAAALGGWKHKKNGPLYRLFSALYFQESETYNFNQVFETLQQSPYNFALKTHFTFPLTPPPDLLNVS